MQQASAASPSVGSLASLKRNLLLTTKVCACQPDASAENQTLQAYPSHSEASVTNLALSGTSPHQALPIEEVPAVEVGPGCLRRDLPSTLGARLWIVEMLPGTQWPHVDRHDTGEGFYVIHGEVIEGETRHRAGTWAHFAPETTHQPRTETGVRLLGYNLSAAAFNAANPR
ncbi:MAG: cupin domain-containing protein [Dokdonella sp.]